MSDSTVEGLNLIGAARAICPRCSRARALLAALAIASALEARINRYGRRRAYKGQDTAAFLVGPRHRPGLRPSREQLEQRGRGEKG